jgi:tetratricopeptide (TPR) repeat protein
MSAARITRVRRPGRNLIAPALFFCLGAGICAPIGALAADTEFVLSRLESASLSLRGDRRDDAAHELDEAIAAIENVFGGTEEARRARSLWYEEKCKVFKGEPYERVMAYYYRGLLYLDKVDYDNARATFRGGMLQDAFAEEEQYRCDFALLLFLDFWASHSLGEPDQMQTAWEELIRLRPDAPRPRPVDNVLVVAETGTSPRKLSDGVGHAALVYRRGKNFKDNRVRICSGQECTDLYPVEDVYLQAATRGGRMVDRILQGKAVFRQARADEQTVLSGVGTVATLAAPLVGGPVGTIGGVVSGVGAFCGLLAMNAQPQADTRYWRSLPNGVHVGTLQLAPGEQELRVGYFTAEGQELPLLGKTVTVKVEQNKPAVVLVLSPDS